MRTLLCCAVLLALASPTTRAADVPTRGSSPNRTNAAGNTAETAPAESPTQTDNAQPRHSGFHPFHSFTYPRRL